ncbi:MAG: GNAT family N-acetyltransferase [Pseudomonadota bacterium]
MKDVLFEHMPAALLDSPIDAACKSGWQRWVQTHGAAKALPPSIGHFATIRAEEPNAGNDLADLIAKRKAPVLFLQKDEIEVPAAVACLNECSAVQMVLRSAPALPDMDVIKPLDARDAEDMLSLAQLCKPGPFAIGTPLLGTFLGIRVNGHLIAMAGQRIRLPGWVEVSGVCVHPDFQGRGFGANLTSAMVHLILAGAKMPFLHSYRENHRAITLYERLGFEVRSEMKLASVGLTIEPVDRMCDGWV